ncbi:MAG: hypothetical protein QM768_22860 [Agriterribacter sp.]
MAKTMLIPLMLILSINTANAQLGAMKMVGKNTKDYKLGFGLFIKTGLAVNEASDFTIEGGVNIFVLNDSYGSGSGTIMCPIKVGYRYTLNQTGEGFCVEPQAGFNVYGITSMLDENGNAVDLKYHGVVLAAGTGYLFTLWNQPFDLNLRYETVIAHGGSNNFVSLGISRFISFKKHYAD